MLYTQSRQHNKLWSTFLERRLFEINLINAKPNQSVDSPIVQLTIFWVGENIFIPPVQKQQLSLQNKKETHCQEQLVSKPSIYYKKSWRFKHSFPNWAQILWFFIVDAQGLSFFIPKSGTDFVICVYCWCTPEGNVHVFNVVFIINWIEWCHKFPFSFRVMCASFVYF